MGAGDGPQGNAANFRILAIVTLCRYEPTHGHTSSVTDRTDIRETPVGWGEFPPPLRRAERARTGVGWRQLASGWRPVSAASLNSARGFSSDPSETISRLKSPDRVHSAKTRAFRLNVGTRLR